MVTILINESKNDIIINKEFNKFFNLNRGCLFFNSVFFNDKELLKKLEQSKNYDLIIFSSFKYNLEYIILNIKKIKGISYIIIDKEEFDKYPKIIKKWLESNCKDMFYINQFKEKENFKFKLTKINFKGKKDV